MQPQVALSLRRYISNFKEVVVTPASPEFKITEGNETKMAYIFYKSINEAIVYKRLLMQVLETMLCKVYNQISSLFFSQRKN